MSKGLEAFKRIQCNYVHVFKARENGKTQLVHDLNTIEKELKALEIIKTKKVDVRAFIEILEDEWTWEQYMDEEDDANTGGHQFSRDRLTKEEYGLLKEVLL